MWISAVRSIVLAAVVALLVVVAVIVGLVVFEAGSRDAPATAGSGSANAETNATPDAPQGDPLTLTLSPPEVCETTTGYHVEAIDVGWVEDDGPKNDGEVIDTWWEEIAEVEVGWTITGGTPPYRLTLDDETFTAEASGKAWVSCALQTGPTSRHEMFGHRRYDGTPVVDSGVKTIAAAVEDANGKRTEASATLDVVIDVAYSDIEILEGGKTYRIFGALMTIPQGVNMRFGAWVDTECQAGDRSLTCGQTYYLEIVGTTPVRVAEIGFKPGSGLEVMRLVSIRPHAGVMGAEPPSKRLTSEERDAFDELTSSIGRWPDGRKEQ